MDKIINNISTSRTPFVDRDETAGDRSIDEGHLEGIDRLRVAFARASWIGFDLDDTLHDFRHSSTSATDTVLLAISQRFEIHVTLLAKRYSTILREKTSAAFSDGRSSAEYRRERFVALLNSFSLETNADFIEELLLLYNAALRESLKLKPGAVHLLTEIVKLGKKIVVITEGPQDGQKWTIHQLGIAGYVSFLATSNYFKVPKTRGLFSQVLKHLDILPQDILYVGDSEKRDMAPAMAEAIYCVHFAEAEDFSTETYPPTINELKQLEQFL